MIASIIAKVELLELERVLVLHWRSTQFPYYCVICCSPHPCPTVVAVTLR